MRRVNDCPCKFDACTIFRNTVSYVYTSCIIVDGNVVSYVISRTDYFQVS